MADAGFEKRIDRPTDALRWALGTAEAVADPLDWVATPVASQRAVRISPGQGQAAQITMPAGLDAKTPEETLALDFTGPMTFQGKLICRELRWLDIDSDTPGTSGFVVLDAGDYASSPGLPNFADVAGFQRRPGEVYHQPLWFAVVQQGDTTVRLTDLRVVGADGLNAATSLMLRTRRLIQAAAGGTAGERDALFGTPTSVAARLALQGTEWFNTTTGKVERYYAQRSTTNPGGMPAAGWYPVGSATLSSAETAIVAAAELHANDRDWTTLVASPNGLGWEAGKVAQSDGRNIPNLSRSGYECSGRGAFFGGPANTQASVVPVWGRPTYATTVPCLMSGSTAGSIVQGFITIYPNGSLHPSGSMAASAQWKYSVR